MQRQKNLKKIKKLSNGTPHILQRFVFYFKDKNFSAQKTNNQ
jgi:hypothetical protein